MSYRYYGLQRNSVDIHWNSFGILRYDLITVVCHKQRRLCWFKEGKHDSCWWNVVGCSASPPPHPTTPGWWGQLVLSQLDHMELFLESTKDQHDYWEGEYGCFGSNWVWLLVRHPGSSFHPLHLFPQRHLGFKLCGWCLILPQLIYLLWSLSFLGMWDCQCCFVCNKGVLQGPPVPSSWCEVDLFRWVYRCCHQSL